MSTYRLTSITASGTLAVSGASTFTSVLASTTLGVVDTSLTSAYIKFGHDTAGNFNAGYIGYTYAGNDSLSSTVNIGYITTGNIPQSILTVGRTTSTFATNLVANDCTFIGLSLTGNINSSGTIVTSNITASTNTTTGALKVAGGASVEGALNIGLAIKTFAGIASTSTTTGSLIVTGGMGVQGALYMGGTLNATSLVLTGSASISGAITTATTFSDITSPSSTTTGAVIVSGGVGIAKDLFVKGVYVVDPVETNLYLTLGNNITGNNNAGYMAFNYVAADSLSNQISFGYIATGNVKQPPKMILGRLGASIAVPLTVSGAGTFTSLSTNGANYFTYSSGTWTPAIYAWSAANGMEAPPTVAYNIRVGTWQMINKIVTVTYYINFTYGSGGLLFAIAVAKDTGGVPGGTITTIAQGLPSAAVYSGTDSENQLDSIAKPFYVIPRRTNSTDGFVTIGPAGAGVNFAGGGATVNQILSGTFSYPVV